MLPAFFLQLSEDEHHVCSAPVSSEATLALWGVVFCDGGHQSVEQYPCENFSCDGEQSYPPVVVAVSLFPFVLVQGDDDSITEILW